jgi:hypothetical protein
MSKNKKLILALLFSVPGTLLILDLIFTGSGQWSYIIGLPSRKTLFLIVTASSLIIYLSHRQSLQIVIASFGLAFFIVVWVLLIPATQSTPIQNSLSDGQLFVGLLFAPAIAFTAVKFECWKNALDLIERFVWMLAIIHIVIYWHHIITGDGAALVFFIQSILEPAQIEYETSVFIGPVGEQYRVFWGSSVFLLLGVYLSACRFKTRSLALNILLSFIIYYAIYISMTRALMLSIPLFFLAAWVCQNYIKLIGLDARFYMLVGSLLFGMTLVIAILADPSILELVGIGRDMSDGIRFEQVEALSAEFVRNPVFGNGLGSSVSLSRSPAAPWSYELSILALYMKIGLAGVAVLLVLFLVAYSALTKQLILLRRLPTAAVAALSKVFALLVCIVFMGNTNPYLLSFLGWGLLVFVLTELSKINDIFNSKKVLN